MNDPLTLLSVIFATAFSPVITEIIKHWKLPAGLSPAVNTLVSLTLFAAGWALTSRDPGALLGFLETAMVVSAASTSAVSLARMRPALDERRELQAATDRLVARGYREAFDSQDDTSERFLAAAAASANRDPLRNFPPGFDPTVKRREEPMPKKDGEKVEKEEDLPW